MTVWFTFRSVERNLAKTIHSQVKRLFKVYLENRRIQPGLLAMVTIWPMTSASW